MTNSLNILIFEKKYRKLNKLAIVNYFGCLLCFRFQSFLSAKELLFIVKIFAI